jgi:group II intron reverse transcriptase/maturase
MNVTENEIKYRQLQNEGCPQKVPAEQEEYVEAYDSARITEINITNTNLLKDPLLEKILDRNNMNQAFKKVKKNKGAAGIDDMGIDELLDHLKENGKDLVEAIMVGKYQPKPVKRVEIPKEEKGKVRKLGIPTVVDRVVQQAIAQILTPIFELQFSDNSFGFRPKRSAHGAMKRCKEFIDEGHKYVVDMDLEKYFDTVNQSKLIEVLSRTIKDGRVISLIHKYLKSGVVEKHTFRESRMGVSQGGPLSPLLSNIMLNELDKELERRGHKFVRYADDLTIFVSSRKSADRTLKTILPFIEKKLFLKVNEDKTSTGYVGRIKFLGFGFYVYKGKAKFRVHPKAIKKMKAKVKELTARSYGVGNIERPKKMRRYIIGWINYFKIADMKSLLKEIDQWMRRRIRMVIWKQWKKIKTKHKNLKKLGIDKGKAWEYANTRKGYWRIANSPILNRSITNERLKYRGYLFFSDYYKQACVN